MGRQRYALVLAAAVSVYTAHSAFSQPGPQQPQQHPTGSQGRATRPSRGGGVERWRQMRPDERQRFRSNAERWLQMAPEERRLLRDREAQRRERIQRETDAALRQSGLELEAERRAQFERRYIEERRRIEQQLRRDIEERRRRELAPVVEQLKKEFGQQKAPPNATVRPANPAASPGK